MHRNISRFVLGLLFAALAVGESGCGSPHFDVTGNVKYNGAPIDKPDGQIVFIGPNGDQVMADIGPDGNYRAISVSSGKNRVAVYYPNPKAKGDRLAKPKPGDTINPRTPTEPPFLTPTKYGVADTSGLSLTVDKETVFDVDLTGPAIR